MSSIRLISDDVTIHFPNLEKTKLISENNYILRFPAGRFAVVCFASHKSSPNKIHPFIQEAIKNDIGVVYVCEALPRDMIIDDHVVYIECPYRWFIHTLFMNPLQFRACFSDMQSERLARAFSEFTKYSIPRVKSLPALQELIEKSRGEENNILIEITGGVGDHLMTIPTLKTLAAKGKQVYILCERHRLDCFLNLPYIAGFFTDRKQVNVSHFHKIYVLHFGQILNDYRSDMNKQNRIFSVAQMCGLSRTELVINKPEIIFSAEELEAARRRWAVYPNKIFFGFDSDRADAKMSESLAQEKINAFKTLGFTVFTSSRKKYNFQNCIDLTQQLELRELFALIAVMDFVVTIDTAFLHIAGALEKKTFALINFFDPTWRCSTYENCRVMTPVVNCFPCVARQFVARCEQKCIDRSCFTYFNWESLYRELKQLKLKVKSSHKVPEIIQEIPDVTPLIPVNGRIDRKTLLISDNDGLGDILMLTPALKVLFERGYQIDIATKCPEIFRNAEFIRYVFHYGQPIKNRNEYFKRFELSYRLSSYEQPWCRQHRVLATAYLLNLKPEDIRDIHPILKLSPSEIALANTFIPEVTKKILCIGFTSADVRREYPRELRQPLIDAIKKAYPDLEIVLVGDTARDARWTLKSKISCDYKHCIDTRGRTSVSELFSIVNRSDYVISVDSVVLHIAGAFKKPSLFLPSSIKAEWRAYPETVICEPLHDCYPCNERNCKCSQNASCLQTLPVETIVAKLKELIQ